MINQAWEDLKLYCKLAMVIIFAMAIFLKAAGRILPGKTFVYSRSFTAEDDY